MKVYSKHRVERQIRLLNRLQTGRLAKAFRLHTYRRNIRPGFRGWYVLYIEWICDEIPTVAHKWKRRVGTYTVKSRNVWSAVRIAGRTVGDKIDRVGRLTSGIHRRIDTIMTIVILSSWNLINENIIFTVFKFS